MNNNNSNNYFFQYFLLFCSIFVIIKISLLYINSDKRRKRNLDSLTEGISEIHIRKGTVIGVYFESEEYALPVLGKTTSGSHSLCKLQGSIDADSLDCTSNSIQDNLVLHAQAKIGKIS